LAQQFPPSDPFDNLHDDDLLALDDVDQDGWDDLTLSAAELDREAWEASPAVTPETGTTAPSLPIILLSAASAIAGGVIALYLAYREFALSIELSAAIATFVASVAMGVTGAIFSALTGSRAAAGNIAFSCGLILLSLLFMGICALVGAAAALFLLLIAR